MEDIEPWDHSWKIKKHLGGGGQGTTTLVERRDSISNPETAVMKVLVAHKASDKEARVRMYQEVSALKVLYAAGAKVPKVIEHNTEEFESESTKLYFIMEHIPGQLLSEWVRANGPLGVQAAVQVGFELSNILRIAVEKGYVHRDIKPDNIMVKDQASCSLVMLDFGLTYNDSQVSSPTRTDEVFGNSFMFLPELRGGAEERRDPRSDLTCIVAIIYFCLTGRRPACLRDHDGKAPHRGAQTLDALANGIQRKSLDSFFDKGFESRISDRFQSIDELSGRLKEIMEPNLQQAPEDFVTIIKREAEALRNDRKIQLSEIRRIHSDFAQSIHQKAREVFATIGKLPPFDFSLTTIGDDISPENSPSKATQISEIPVVVVSVPVYQFSCHTDYAVFCQDQEALVARRYRRTLQQRVRGIRNVVTDDWKLLFRQPAREKIDMNLIANDIQIAIREMVTTLRASIEQSVLEESIK